VVLIDLDEPTVVAAAEQVATSGDAAVEPFVLDITSRTGGAVVVSDHVVSAH